MVVCVCVLPLFQTLGPCILLIETQSFLSDILEPETMDIQNTIET